MTAQLPIHELLAKLRAEHVPVRRTMRDTHTNDLWQDNRCEVCHVQWPCPTSVTLDGHDSRIEALLVATAPVNRTVCPTCGGNGVVASLDTTEETT